MTENTQQKLNHGPLLDPRTLPKNILDWIGSEHAIQLISEINTRLGLTGERRGIMATLIAKLIAKRLDPKDFVNELSIELNISFDSAKSITNDIVKSVLNPIEIDLRKDLEVDIKLIDFGKPKSKAPEQISETITVPQSTAVKETPSTPKITTVDLQSFKIRSEQSIRPLSPLTFPSTRSGQVAPAMKEERTEELRNGRTEERWKEEKQEIPATPFILHQETPTVAPSINLQPQETPTIKSSLTMKVQNFYQSSSVPERPVQKPVSVRIETLPSNFNEQKIIQPIQINPVRSSSETLNSALTNLTEHSPSWKATEYSASNGVNKQDAPPASKPELPAMPPASANNNEVRVVHYSDLRTPLNSLGIAKDQITKDNILDLRKFNA